LEHPVEPIDPANFNDTARAAAAAKTVAEDAARDAADAAVAARRHQSAIDRIEHVRAYLRRWAAAIGPSASGATFSECYTEQPGSCWNEDMTSYESDGHFAMICRIAGHDYLGVISFKRDDEYRDGCVFNERQAGPCREQYSARDRPIEVVILIAGTRNTARTTPDYQFPGFIRRPANTIIEIGAALLEEEEWLTAHRAQPPEMPIEATPAEEAAPPASTPDPAPEPETKLATRRRLRSITFVDESGYESNGPIVARRLDEQVRRFLDAAREDDREPARNGDYNIVTVHGASISCWDGTSSRGTVMCQTVVYYLVYYP
jgi:hypothetical protein